MYRVCTCFFVKKYLRNEVKLKVITARWDDTYRRHVSLERRRNSSTYVLEKNFDLV